MNISSTALAEWDGGSSEDRPDYVDDALTASVKIGWGVGRPVVAPPGGRDSDLRLGESGDYSHYVDRDAVIRPNDGVKEFLTELFDGVDSLDAASDETNIPEDRLRTAAKLHGIDIPDGGEGGGSDRQIDSVTLPSGEKLPLEVLDEAVHSDKLVLSALASAGMSTSEISRYLSEQLDEDVSTRDVWESCVRANLLGGEVPGDDRDENETVYPVEAGVSVPEPPDESTIEKILE